MENVYDIKRNENLYFTLMDECNDRRITFQKKEVCIGIHLYYLDTVEYFFHYIKNIPSEVDIIFTISSKELEMKIRECLKKYSMSNYIFIYKENQGRDISALLVAMRKELMTYKYFCFIHDKKEKHELMKQGTEKWIQSLWRNMIESADYIYSVVEFLKKRDDIGLLIPPPPISKGKYARSTFVYSWYNDYKLTEELSNRLDLRCNLCEDKPPISLGTAFWCKTEALRKLFTYDWKYEDFTPEPLPLDGTLSHAIERIFPYVAQDAGYKTAEIMSSSFASEYNQIMRDIAEKAFLLLKERMGICDVNDLYRYDELEHDLAAYCKKYKTIYIYGAGMVGRGCLRFLQRNDINPKAFVVSRITDERKEYLGYPIIEITHLNRTEDIGIIVAVSAGYLGEIDEQLERLEIKDYFNWVY